MCQEHVAVHRIFCRSSFGQVELSKMDQHELETGGRAKSEGCSDDQENGVEHGLFCGWGFGAV